MQNTGNHRTRALAREAAVPQPAWKLWWAFVGAAALVAALAAPLNAQTERPLIDVQSYEIDARIDPGSSQIQAEAKVTFIPREETNEVIFELHNGLEVTRVTTDDGQFLNPLRYRQDFTVRVSYPNSLLVGTPTTLTFEYGGQLIGYENSPIEGIDAANIRPDKTYLLYPARWFPVNGYAADQFSSTIRVTAPAGYTALGGGLVSTSQTDNGEQHTLTFSQSSFPGNVALVQSEPVRAEVDGVTTTVYFPGQSEDLARQFGEATSEMVAYYTELFGPPYSQNLILVELGEYGPDAYAGPGVVFMSPYAIAGRLNRHLLGTQVAHQWWRSIVTPGNQSHWWLDKGLAWYAALMELGNAEGEEAFEAKVQETRVEALTYNDIPIIQAYRLPEFSPELNALAGARAAMVTHMLRWTIGDEAFESTLRRFAREFAWKSAVTADLEQIAEEESGKDLSPFFLQWIESTATPEFKQEYTIYRKGGGDGFQVLGKVEQDMDTFSMPVEIKIETEGEPEYKTINVTGKASDYTIESFGKPRRVVLDPNHRILRFDDDIRVKVAIRKGEQLFQLGYYNDALIEYQKALDINRYSSLAHYRIGEVFFRQNNYQSAANEFRATIDGDQVPEWTIVWSHINLGMIFDVTGQRDRAVNEYQLAIRTRDNTQDAQDVARKYLEEPYRRERRQERVF